MKKLLLISTCAIIFAGIGCEHSEGTKFGLLQKVSHKTSPCKYWEIQVAYTGGAATTSSSGDASFSNTQNFAIDSACADTLSMHVGDHIVFEYKDRGVMFCEESKIITSLKIK